MSVASAAEPDAHDEHAWILALAALLFVVFDVWYLTRAPRPVSLGGPARTNPAPIPARRAEHTR